MQNLLFLVLLISFSMNGLGESILDKDGIQKQEGYFNTYYNENDGKLYVEVQKLDEEFLFVNYLSHGVGSNDLGLDRGKVGGNRVVYFKKMGDKLMLVQPNLDYRAVTDNELERQSVEQAFAKSVLFGFKIEEKTKKGYLIDFTPFLMEDHQNVSGTLGRGQGNYSIDKSRSAVSMERTKSFPKNTEFESMITFKGKPKSWEIRSVTPDAQYVTVYQHLSFVELPDDGYEARKWHPQCGSFAFTYQDYASSIERSTEQKYIQRHRLEKKDPKADVSVAVEPIIYYLDNGTPEPVRSALLEGGRWWNQAFEAIGYKDAFQLKVLPDDADPLDIRYNVVQWVHRSTRGWSYGMTVVDPRTGEILKGHVSLGSLRIRQDFMIAQALSKEPFKDSDDETTAMKEMALARIRQLSAHEIGHTLGFAHNFAASTNYRASVMDYPHPKLGVKEGLIDLSDAYDTGIGVWDKQTVAYAYSDFGDKDESSELQKILDQARDKGFRYISDADARPVGGSHAYGHLWDNGGSTLTEFQNILAIRDLAMSQFSIHNIRSGESLDKLEDLYVLIYFMHRYQTEAVVKLIGGQEYHYGVKGDGFESWKAVPVDDQKTALTALLVTLQPEVLATPKHILELLEPRARGRGRESFKSQAGPAFDPLGAVMTSSKFSLRLLLHPQRLNRLVLQEMQDPNQLKLTELIDELFGATLTKGYPEENMKAMNATIGVEMLNAMFRAAENTEVYPEVKFTINKKLKERLEFMKKKQSRSETEKLWMNQMEDYFANPDKYKTQEVPGIPDGSPIGSYECSSH